MTAVVMDNGDPQVLLSHMAFYGLAAILDETGDIDVRLSWTSGMRPRPQLEGDDLTWQRIAQVVQAHAVRRAEPGDWLSEEVVLKGSARGLMSPRITTVPDKQWPQFQANRHAVLDRLTEQRRELDLRLIAALGEPAYWRRNLKGDRLQDDGASRLEMQPRNQGSEIVGNRLRKLAHALAGWPVDHVEEGLSGKGVRDDIGRDKPDSRTATGFAAPGPTDNAVAWCALWGISLFPLAHQTSRTSVTAGHLGVAGAGWFYVPVWEGCWSLARLESIVACEALRIAAGAGLSANEGRTSVVEDSARRWLAGRDVAAVVRFPVQRYGTDNAPQRRAQRGQILPCG